MESKTTGTILSVKKQWWLKINTKPVRAGTFDGAVFPHIVRVKFSVDGVEYIRNKWLGASIICPVVNEKVTVIYRENKPTKFRLELPGCFGEML